MEQLEFDANWAGLEHDVHWHISLGWSLTDAGYIDEARAHYHQALELDANAWPACEALAHCARRRKQPADAVRWAKEAIEKLPNCLSEYLATLWSFVGLWLLDMDDLDGAYDAAMHCSADERVSFRAQSLLLMVHWKRGEFGKIVALAERLHDHEPSNREHNALVRLIYINPAVMGLLGPCYRVCGSPRWMSRAVHDARHVMESSDKVYTKAADVEWSHFLGLFYYTCCGLEDEAVRLFKLFLKTLFQEGPEAQKEFGSDYHDTVNVMSVIYYNAAVRSFNETGKTDSVSAAKLKDVAVAVSTGNGPGYDGFDVFVQDYPAMLWGRWLQEYEKADEATWRKCFRVRMLEHLNKLDDDDPSNDTKGLTQLAMTLLHAGDRTNAGAALAVLLKSLEDGQRRSGPQNESAAISSSQSPSVSTIAVGPEPSTLSEGLQGLRLHLDAAGTVFSCDGCMTDIPEAKVLYFCEICNCVNWCDACFEAFQDPEQRASRGLYECDPKHSFYRAWPIPEEARYRAAQSFENGVVLRKAWLEQLRNEWWE